EYPVLRGGCPRLTCRGSRTPVRAAEGLSARAVAERAHPHATALVPRCHHRLARSAAVARVQRGCRVRGLLVRREGCRRHARYGHGRWHPEWLWAAAGACRRRLCVVVAAGTQPGR